MNDAYSFARKKLMTPGPVALPEYVKKSFHELEAHHRSKEFVVILMDVFAKLKQVFQTEQHCFLLSCTGTGAMEAALVNHLNFGENLLVINSGKFGERWMKMGEAFGLKVKNLEFPWGEEVDLNLIEQEIKSGQYKAVAVQACETSTGALLPIQKIGEMTKDTKTLLIVDGITALGAVNIPMDDWHIDVLIGGSQKAFMLPTGMAFLSQSEKAQNKKSSLPKFYWDLSAEKKSNLDGKTRFSTPAHFILALNMVLEEVVNQYGVQGYFNEIQKRAELFRKEIHLNLFPQVASPSLSCMSVPERLSAKELVKKVSQEGITIMAGQDQLEDKVIRVGHMGAMTSDEILKTAKTINQFI